MNDSTRLQVSGSLAVERKNYFRTTEKNLRKKLGLQYVVLVITFSQQNKRKEKQILVNA